MGLGLAQALRLSPVQRGEHVPPQAIAFVGAGGKSTALFQLARQLAPPVLITTTTHLGIEQATLADHHVVVDGTADVAALPYDGVTLVTGARAVIDTSGERLTAIQAEVLSALRDHAQRQGIPLLIEADGSRRKALKAPAEHEPSIPAFADMVIVVAGLSGVGQPLDAASVHRPEQFAALGGLRIGDVITTDALVRVLTSPDGGLKTMPRRARRMVILNQADTEKLQAQAGSMAPELLKGYDAALTASLQSEQIYAVHEPVAGVILAAGSASRFGKPKVLLDWRGQPFVRAVASTALAAGLDPVVVVTGSNRTEVAAALDGLPVSIAHNEDWASGQASSLRRGLETLPANTGAAIFLLADQPQMPANVIAALRDRHAANLAPIVAPLVMEERRANPVLFDRATFRELLALQGDVGGRAIFSRFGVEYMPWHDDRLLIDVDTPEDYRRLLEDDTL